MALYMLGIKLERLKLLMGNINDMGEIVKHATLALEIDDDFIILNNLTNNLQNHNKNLFYALYLIDINGITLFTLKFAQSN